MGADSWLSVQVLVLVSHLSEALKVAPVWLSQLISTVKSALFLSELAFPFGTCVTLTKSLTVTELPCRLLSLPLQWSKTY